MGYTEVLNVLETQLQEIKNEQEYIKKQYDIALSSKHIAMMIGCNIRSVQLKLNRLIKEDNIKCIKANKEIKDIRTKRYILKIRYCKENKIIK